MEMYAEKYPGGTVITKKQLEYSLAKNASSIVSSTATLVQYPIILAFAVTAHKIQGQTIERDWNVVMDLRYIFRHAQAE